LLGVTCAFQKEKRCWQLTDALRKGTGFLRFKHYFVLSWLSCSIVAAHGLRRFHGCAQCNEARQLFTSAGR
jgi:hypothetical protein